MKIGITGGAGFIGSNLVSFLTQKDFECKIFDNLETGDIKNLVDIQSEFLKGDLRDEKQVFDFIVNLDYVIHLGALGSIPRSVENPRKSIEVNTLGTLNVMEAARKKDVPVIFSSSSSVYGRNSRLPKIEKDWAAPISPYAASKLSAEAIVLSYQYIYGLTTTVFRFFNVFGPNQKADHVYSAVIPKWALAAFRKEPLLVFGDGEQIRDFTFVNDLCGTLFQNIEKQIMIPDPINLAFGNPISLNNLLQLFKDYFGTLDIEYRENRKGDVKVSEADTTALYEIFGEQEITPIQNALEDTFKWIKKAYGF